VASLVWNIRNTGIGHAPRYAWRDGKLLLESAPSVVAELARRIEQITSTIHGQQVPAVSSVGHPTAEAGRAIIAENYAAYVAEYCEPGSHELLPGGWGPVRERRAVRQARTKAAAQLLTSSSLPAAEVAARCGFGSAESLRQAFVAQYGLSPSQYRRNHAG
jgi:AraC-like DNA-binding protein